MSDPEYVPGEGDVEIELLGKKEFLKCSLGACLRISASGELGVRVLSDKCLNLDFSTIAFIVASGLDKPVEDVQVAVFKTGMINLFGPCLRFLRVISYGGRLPTAEDENKPADPPPSS